MKHASLLFVDIYFPPKIKIDNELKSTLTFELLFSPKYDIKKCTLAVNSLLDFNAYKNNLV